MTTAVEKKEDLKPEGLVSKEQIETWKSEKKIDDVHEITIADPKGKKVYYLSEPNDIVYAQAMSLMAEKKITKAGEALLNACYLGGCAIPERSEKTLYRTLCIQASTTIEFFETETAKH